MHIPDGFVDAKTAVASAAISSVGLAVALRRVRLELPARRMPMLGLSAAFLFAAQLVNFPVAGGTSGHLMGGVLVAALLGPSAAMVVMATVLVVQCLLFGDGGLSALGANMFDMGLLGTGGGYLIHRMVAKLLGGLRGQVAAIAFAGWCSVVLAAVGCAGQLAWSQTLAFSTGFVVMAGVHMLIGLGEGLISAVVFLAIRRVRPDLAASVEKSGRQGGSAGAWGYGVLAALGIALFVAPFASPWPDGLESVAMRLGFAHKANGAILPAAVPDYHLPGVHSATVATALGGALGTVVVFGLALLLGRVLVRERPKAKDSQC
jgi:cobalt/nickel transport system permease protein